MDAIGRLARHVRYVVAAATVVAATALLSPGVAGAGSPRLLASSTEFVRDHRRLCRRLMHEVAYPVQLGEPGRQRREQRPVHRYAGDDKHRGGTFRHGSSTSPTSRTPSRS